MRSVLTEFPFEPCSKWITANINFCHTTAEAWELDQETVCSACVNHNRARTIEINIQRKETVTYVRRKADGMCYAPGCTRKVMYHNRVYCSFCLKGSRVRVSTSLEKSSIPLAPPLY